MYKNEKKQKTRKKDPEKDEQTVDAEISQDEADDAERYRRQEKTYGGIFDL